MKKSLVALSLFFAMVCSIPGAEKFKMTLEQAKAYALQNNPTLAMARANIAAAAAAVKSATSAYYPTLSVQAQYTRVRDSNGNKVRPDYENEIMGNRDFDNDNLYSVGASAGWLVFDGGSRYFNRLVARYGSDMAVNACDDAKRVLFENVSHAFYAVIRAQNSMDIALKDAEFNRMLHQDAETRLENGVAKPSEVLNFEYQVGKAEVSFISAEENWREACVVLGKLLVLDQESIWDVIELIAPASDSLKEQPKNDVGSLIEYALAHRSDLRSAQHAVDRAAAQMKQTGADYFPKVSLFANYEFERMHKYKFNKHYDRNVNFGAVAQWDLFTGFSTVAKRESAEAQLEYERRNLDSLSQSIVAEVRQNCIALESSYRTLEKQNKQLEIAQKIRDLVKEEYDGGTATITRLNEVQTDLTNAALAQSIAYISVLDNLEKLRSSTGENIEEQ